MWQQDFGTMVCKFEYKETNLVKLETQWKKETEIMYLDDKKEDLTKYAGTRKLHEVNNNKGDHQLISIQ